MSGFEHIQTAKDLSFGKSPALDAWILHFMTENSLEYSIDPVHNASPEQLRFMVCLDEKDVYVPCSDMMLKLLVAGRLEGPLMTEYLKKWRVIVRLVRTMVKDPYLKKKILNLCRHKFRLYRNSHIIIPSRLMKRMTTIFLTQSGQDRPYKNRKQVANKRAWDIVHDKRFDRVLNVCPENAMACQKISELRNKLDLLELKRLLSLSTFPDLWRVASDKFDWDRVSGEIREPCPEFRALDRLLYRTDKPKRILYLPNLSGGIIFDIQVIRSLLRQGHKVILALKEEFYYHAPCFWDHEDDPVLDHALLGARFVDNGKMTKNELLSTTRENPFVVISDGTRERLNLHRVSVTFSRAWKESDIILAKGEANHRRLMLTSHQYTRDILCFYRDHSGKFHAEYKPKPDWVKKFSEEDLSSRADKLVAMMREARAQGKAVMFYSGIIGSIPHQTSTAIRVMNTFVNYLRGRMAGTFIINPAEHFEEGMDGDDLMFMWERVQRSGLLGIWRFQTVEDIEKSFELMFEKVPPVWAGKDSTYSTGCTKEMNIALETQAIHPELQIIGPDPEKFFRRREYGVGKYCDVVVNEC